MASFCRFRNTLKDLQDCQEVLWDQISEDENNARIRLIRICKEIAEEVNDDDLENMINGYYVRQ